MVKQVKKNIYIITLIIIIIDQLIKKLVISKIAYLEVVKIIGNFFFFTNVKNTGGAWSLLDNYPFLLTLIGATCIIVLNQYLLNKKAFTKLETIYFGLIMGGMIGNFLDRILVNGVIDFIGFRFGNYQYPIFNIADIAIVVGVGLVILELVRGEIYEYRSNKRKN